MHIVMSFVVFSILSVIVAWIAYARGRNRGQIEGYQAGWGNGLKQGRDEGMKAGLKEGIKEHMLTTLVDARPMPGMHEELHQQVKDELLKAINTKPEQKKAAVSPKRGIIAMLWEEFGGWLLIAGFILLLVYLFQSG
jgi:hypothetical protein